MQNLRRLQLIDDAHNLRRIQTIRIPAPKHHYRLRNRYRLIRHNALYHITRLIPRHRNIRLYRNIRNSRNISNMDKKSILVDHT
jgi:hypothetical protein